MGETPAKLMFGRELRTRWDALQTHKQDTSFVKSETFLDFFLIKINSILILFIYSLY